MYASWQRLLGGHKACEFLELILNDDDRCWAHLLIPEVTCVEVSDAGLGGAGKARQGSVVGPHDCGATRPRGPEPVRCVNTSHVRD